MNNEKACYTRPKNKAVSPNWEEVMQRPTSWTPKHKTQILCCAVWCDSAPRARHRITTPGIIPQKRGTSNPELAIGGVEWNRLFTNQMRLGQWPSAWGIFQSLVNLCAHTQRAQLTVLHTCQYTQVPIRSTDDSPGFTSDQGQEYQLYMGARSGPNVTSMAPARALKHICAPLQQARTATR